MFRCTVFLQVDYGGLAVDIPKSVIYKNEPRESIYIFILCRQLQGGFNISEDV